MHRGTQSTASLLFAVGNEAAVGQLTRQPASNTGYSKKGKWLGNHGDEFKLQEQTEPGAFLHGNPL